MGSPSEDIPGSQQLILVVTVNLWEGGQPKVCLIQLRWVQNICSKQLVSSMMDLGMTEHS